VSDLGNGTRKLSSTLPDAFAGNPEKRSRTILAAAIIQPTGRCRRPEAFKDSVTWLRGEYPRLTLEINASWPRATWS